MSIKLYTNLDHGYLHIASEEKYQGCLRYYENFFARFFLHVFCLSVDIHVNGDEYRVSRRTYVHLLRSMGVKNATWKTASIYRNLNRQQLSPLTTNGFMRNHLPAQKVHDLGLKLFEEITHAYKIEKIKDLLGEGADPDILFSFDGFRELYYYGWQEKSRLPHTFITPFSVYQSTPLLAAAKINDVEMIQLFLRFGSNQQIQGSEHFVSRRISKKSFEFVEIPDAGSQTYLIQEFQDDWFNFKKLTFHNNEVEFINCKDADKTERWTERTLVRTNPLSSGKDTGSRVETQVTKQVYHPT